MTSHPKSSRVPMAVFGLSCVGVGYCLANVGAAWANAAGPAFLLAAVFSGVVARSRSNY